jgi:hypothetical protein
MVKRKTLTEDERLRELAISREKLAWDIASREEGARAVGQSEAQRAIARKMLQHGHSLSEIMEVTDLPKSELLLLQTEGHLRH